MIWHLFFLQSFLNSTKVGGIADLTASVICLVCKSVWSKSHWVICKKMLAHQIPTPNSNRLNSQCLLHFSMELKVFPFLLSFYTVIRCHTDHWYWLRNCKLFIAKEICIKNRQVILLSLYISCYRLDDHEKVIEV